MKVIDSIGQVRIREQLVEFIVVVGVCDGEIGAPERETFLNLRKHDINEDASQKQWLNDCLLMKNLEGAIRGGCEGYLLVVSIEIAAHSQRSISQRHGAGCS